MRVKVFKFCIYNFSRAKLDKKFFRTALRSNFLQMFAIIVHTLNVERTAVNVVGDVFLLDKRTFRQLGVKFLKAGIGLLHLKAGRSSTPGLLLYEQHGHHEEKRQQDNGHKGEHYKAALPFKFHMVRLVDNGKSLLYLIYAPKRVTRRGIVHAPRHVGVGMVDVALVVKDYGQLSQR